MKPDDIPFIVKDVQNEMPHHSEQSYSIPKKQFGQFPKNLMNYSADVDNKFLNNHLSEIEELYHCFPDMNKGYFQEYQNKHFRNSDILNHDGFLNHSPLRLPRFNFSVHSMMMNRTSINRGAANGADLFSQYQGTAEDAGNNSGIIWAQKMDLGTASELYDQIAISIASGSGNMRLGVYDHNSGDTDPENLEVESGSIALVTDYSFQSVTEWSLATTQEYAAFQVTATNQEHFGATAAGDQFQKTHTYGIFIDPLGTSSSRSDAFKMKIGHT